MLSYFVKITFTSILPFFSSYFSNDGVTSKEKDGSDTPLLTLQKLGESSFKLHVSNLVFLSEVMKVSGDKKMLEARAILEGILNPGIVDQ